MFFSSSKSDLYIKNRNTPIHTKKQAIAVLGIQSCSAKYDCIKKLCYIWICLRFVLAVLTLMRLDLQNQMQIQPLFHYNKPWHFFKLPKHVNASLHQLVQSISTFPLSQAEKVKIQDRCFNLKINYQRHLMPCRACSLGSVVDLLIPHTLVDPVSHILSDRHQKRCQDSTELIILLYFGGCLVVSPQRQRKVPWNA